MQHKNTNQPKKNIKHHDKNKKKQSKKKTTQLKQIKEHTPQKTHQ